MRHCLAIICLAMGGLMARAQSTNSVPAPKREVLFEAPRREKGSEINTNILSSSQIKSPKEPVLTYSGVAADVAHSSEKTWKIFSLRKPANPKEDGANLVRDLRTTGAGAGVKLFSIDF